MTVPEIVDPELLPDLSDPWAREICALSPDVVLQRAHDGWHRLKRDEWELSLLLYRIGKERLYGQYGSITAWARHVLGKKSSGEVAKLREQGQWLIEGVPATDRAAIVECASPKMLSEAGVHRLSRRDPEKALAIAKSGKTQREMREAVHAEEAERLHLDSGQLRTLHFKAITLEAHRAFLRATRRAKFFCQTPHPSDSEIVELIATEAMEGFQVAPEYAEHVGRMVASWHRPEGPALDAERTVLVEAGIAAIDAGLVACLECKATNGNLIELHHSHSVSVGGKCSPQVPLCMNDHAQVKEDLEGGGWRGHVERWMARPDLAWFRHAFEAYLDGRSLDGTLIAPKP